MEQTQVTGQGNFVQLVAYFLAEILRSRRTSLRRVAEISQLMVDNLSSFTSEAAALSWVTEIEKDFAEMTNLKQALRFNYNVSSVGVYEREIKDFAAELFKKDLVRSADFLKDASKEQATVQLLCIKYPDFCDYLFASTDKGQLLPEFLKPK